MGLLSQIHPPTREEAYECERACDLVESSAGEDWWKRIVDAIIWHGSRFVDYVGLTLDDHPERIQVIEGATIVFSQWIGGRQFCVEPTNSERRALMAVQFWFDNGENALWVAADLVQCILALPAGHQLRDETLVADIQKLAGSRPS
jgi:hypothetical protein